jgi:glyoxylase-like metal-dependent hydrolase (beta-lactamase superfamily II)
MQQIERGIYYEDSFLGVTVGGLVFSHGTIMIDAPLRLEDSRTWRSALINQRSNRLLVYLDAHPDRTLGARAMDCTILAHQKTAQVFRSRSTIFKGQFIETGAAWESYPDAIGIRWASPDIIFTHRTSLHWGGPEVVLEHHPGPTAGATWVVVSAERVVFIGDLVVINQPPFLADADLEGWLESLELLMTSYTDYLIISGRGGVVRKEAIRAQYQLIKNANKGIERLAKHNASPDDTLELIPSLLADFDFDDHQTERFTQRLKYGLYQAYARRYRPSSALEQPVVEDDEA